MQLTEVAQVIGDTSTAIAVVVALFTIRFAYVQIRLNNSLAAHDSYSELLKTMIEYPQFANPNYVEICMNDLSYQRYKRYVGYLFTVCERVLRAEPRTEYWQATVKHFLRQHSTHLRSTDFNQNHFEHFSPEMQTAMLTVLESTSIADGGHTQ
jgi:hypothetical protein